MDAVLTLTPCGQLDLTPSALPTRTTHRLALKMPDNTAGEKRLYVLSQSGVELARAIFPEGTATVTLDLNTDPIVTLFAGRPARYLESVTLLLGQCDSTLGITNAACLINEPSASVETSPAPNVTDAINTAISDQKGAPDGLASLDSSGKLDANQKPVYTAEEVGAASASDLSAAMASVAQTYAPLVSPLFPGTVRANTFIAPLQNNLISKTTMNYQGFLVDNNGSGSGFRGTLYGSGNILYYPSYSSSPVYYRFGTGTGSNEKDNVARFGDIYAVTDSVLNTVANGYMPITGPVLNAGYRFLDYDNENNSETKTIDISGYDSFSVFTSGPNYTAWIVNVICQKPEKVGVKKTIAILPLPDESHNIDLSFTLPDSRIFKGTWDGNPVQGSLIKIEMEAIQSVYSNNEPPTLGWAVTVILQPL